MRWLLDTCVVAEVTRKLPNPGVIQWLQANASLAGFSAVTLGEIQSGTERMAPGRGRNSLQLWFDGLCAQYAQRILPTDEAVWRTYGRLKASLEAIGKPQDDLDLLIAATATVHQRTLVTRNTRHFDDTGILTLNPWLPN